MAIRVVIDTNIWVSSLLNPYGFPATLRKYFGKGAFQAIISEPILEELAEYAKNAEDCKAVKAMMPVTVIVIRLTIRASLPFTPKLYFFATLASLRWFVKTLSFASPDHSGFAFVVVFHYR